MEIETATGQVCQDLEVLVEVKEEEEDLEVWDEVVEMHSEDNRRY